MKKLIALATASFAFLFLASNVMAGAKNATFVKFLQGGNEMESYWMTTGSGLVHEWRYDEGGYDLHFVFKPADKFEYSDCDSENLWFSNNNWSYSLGGYYEEYSDPDADEGQLTEYLIPGDHYRVCAYRVPVDSE